MKQALQDFLKQADLRKFSHIDSRDTIHLWENVHRRLKEEDSIQYADSIALELKIRHYQKAKNLKVTGKPDDAFIKKLNQTDRLKFMQVAINLDRFKQMGPFPSNFIWVNIPSYQLEVREADTVALRSRVVVGKPGTRTPVITSAITDMITYPLWHIPNSIIKGEILPNLKKDPGYLARKGFSLSDWQGNVIDPYQVNWSKYENTIPYRVIQGSGDDNALGVIKFNFPNKYSVYLHDTNQRSLFSREKRALSHGCVRVQAWNELATYLLRRDSAAHAAAVPVDSLKQWLAIKEKHVIPLRKRMPLFIKYQTCGTEEGRLLFYEDIYGIDRKLYENYFATK